MLNPTLDFIREETTLTLLAYLFAGVVAVFAIIKKKSSQKMPYPPDVVILHTPPPVPACPSTSPFPNKLECFFRMANIPYKREHKNVFGKKGKFPWISYKGEDIPDTQFIIEHFKKNHGVDLNKGLTNEQKAVAHSLRVMVDEHLYWCMAEFRWIRGYNSPEMVRLFSFFLLRRFIRSRIKSAMNAQGMGRHSFEEILHIMKQDFQVLQDYLGNKPYMMGDEPTEVDCSVFGVLAMAVYTFSNDEIMKDYIEKEFPNLYQYLLRIKEKFYPDWEKACTECDELTYKS